MMLGMLTGNLSNLWVQFALSVHAASQPQGKDGVRGKWEKYAQKHSKEQDECSDYQG